MKRLSILAGLLLAIAGAAAAQQPDCVIPVTLTAVGQSTANFTCGHNTLGIYEWHFVYFNNGFSALSVVVQSAPDSGGSPGTWVTFVGTVNTGVNPNTLTTYADTILTGYNPWNRVHLTSATGSGTISGTMYGCRWPGCATPPPSTGSGCPGTVMTPCVVDGVTAAGMPPTTPPVLVAGWDGTNLQTLKTDTLGNQFAVGPTAAGSAPTTGPLLMAGWDLTNIRRLVTDSTGRALAVGAAANGAAAAGNPVLAAGWDGANVRIPLYCPNQAVVSFNTSGAHQIVGASGSTLVYLCNVVLSNAAGVNIFFQSGTGANCVVGTTTLTGTFQNVLTATLFDPKYPLAAAASQAVCINLGANVDVEGTVFYAQF